MNITTTFTMAKGLLLASLLFSIALPLHAQEPYQWILNMISKEKKVRSEAATNLLQLKNVSYAPAMVDVLFYMPRSARGEMIEILEKTTGQKAGDNYYDWVEYIGKRSDLKSPPGYVKFKVTLLSLIDPTYKKILYTGVFLKIRPEEIVWGGVKLDGIPPIDTPSFIGAVEAKLKDNEKIFGVSLKGEARAYPLRYLSWHEMLNDRIAGESVSISY
jgi:Protein of unknown function (DUF3179)